MLTTSRVKPSNLKDAIAYMFRGPWAGMKSEYQQASKINQALHYFGNIKLTSITTQAIAEYQAYLSQVGNKGSTVNRKVATLMSLLDFAWKAAWIKEKPYVRSKRITPATIRFLTRAEYTRLYEWLEGNGYRTEKAACQVLVCTGVRVGELISYLESGDEPSSSRITLRDTKSGNTRTVPLTARASSALNELLVSRRELGVTLSSRGSSLTYQAFKQVWDKAMEALGWSDREGYTPHILRHTCASWLVQSGVELQAIKELLGHSSIDMTMRYAHLSPTYLKDAISVLEEI